MLFTLVFMPLEYAGFAMDSRQLHFAQRRALVWRHRWLMLGFGASASLSLLLPLLNFVCMPALVVRQCDMHECRKPSSSVMPRDEGVRIAWSYPHFSD